MEIAILYICTGGYAIFFDGFYASVEKYFLLGCKKHYFVWTDNDNLALGLKNVTIIHKECEGFPLDSLFRFDMFLQVENLLVKFDYVYFFNSNAQVICPIGDDILPDRSGLVMGVWPYSYSKPSYSFTYERRRSSLAYVSPYGKNYLYYMGGLNGGTTEDYLRMIRQLSANIHEDYKKGIVAIYHDESHINSYMRNHECKKLGREYCLPEEWVQKQDTPKIIFRNKEKYDSCFNKSRLIKQESRITRKIKYLWNILRWYMMI